MKTDGEGQKQLQNYDELGAENRGEYKLIITSLCKTHYFISAESFWYNVFHFQ